MVSAIVLIYPSVFILSLPSGGRGSGLELIALALIGSIVAIVQSFIFPICYFIADQQRKGLKGFDAYIEGFIEGLPCGFLSALFTFALYAGILRLILYL